jgi:RNA polymerase sigma-70 factor (ECF subfamily)
MYSAELSSPRYRCNEYGLIDDDELVVAAQSGSESAFRELYRRNSGLVLRSIGRVVRDRADAEDAFQDSLMRAFSHIHQFDRRSRFSTWLTSIAINSAFMVLRKTRRASETSLDFADGEGNMGWKLDLADIAPNPEDICFSNEMTRIIDRVISRLPLNLRAVTELRLVQDLALHEIAATLNITVSATKSRLLRARRRMAGSIHRMGLQQKRSRVMEIN